MATVWVAGLAGHLYAAAPDVLFVAAELVHQWWMDVFALHVSIRFIPAPPAVLLVVFTLALAGWAAAVLGRRRTAATTLVATLVLFVSALALRGEPPTTLHQLRRAPQLALGCSLEIAGHAPRSGASVGHGVHGTQADGAEVGEAVTSRQVVVGGSR